jgi:hypothetical protein
MIAHALITREDGSQDGLRDTLLRGPSSGFRRRQTFQWLIGTVQEVTVLLC